MGSTWPWQCKRVKVGQDTLAEAFLWCNESCLWMFIPFLVSRSCGSPGGWGGDFLSSFLPVVPIWSYPAPVTVSAFRAGYCPVLSTPSPVSALSSPQAQGKLDCLGLFAPRGVQVMSKIHTCLRQVVSVQQKYEFSTSVSSGNAKCFCRNLQNERTHFFSAWDFTILTWEEFVFHLVLGSDSSLV